MQKLIIDTDPGQDIDDLLAIHFALRRPELDVRAITTVTWPSDRRARLVRRLLRYLDRRDIPVAAGMQFPMRPLSAAEYESQMDDRRTMNHAAFAEPPDPADDPDGGDAVDLIIRTIRRHPGEIALACIGPLTNIAAALCREPTIAGQIRYIALMGGEVDLPRAEHNIVFDPVAADIVLRSGVPLFMGTLSVTRQVVLSMADCERFRRHSSPLCQALGQAIALWHPAQSWKPGPVLYDLFPIIWSFDRTLYTTQPMAVQVGLRGDLTRGMTIVGGQEANAEVTTAVRADEVRALYLQTALG